MVKMSVGEKDSIYGFRWDGEWSPVSSPKMPFLIKPAINKKPVTIGFQKVCGTSYVLGRAQETQLNLQLISL